MNRSESYYRQEQPHEKKQKRKEIIVNKFSKKDFTKRKLLGFGGFGEVSKACLNKKPYPHQEVVLKTIKTHTNIGFDSFQTEKQVLTELHSSPFVVQLLGTIEDQEEPQQPQQEEPQQEEPQGEKEEEKREKTLVLEEMKGGDMYELLGESKRLRLSSQVGGLHERLVQQHIAQVILALTHLQKPRPDQDGTTKKHCWAWCDLKPENIMLDGQHGHLKLIDFGCAVKIPKEEEDCLIDSTTEKRKLSSKNGAKVTRKIFTLEYMAPELLFPDEDDDEFWRHQDDEEEKQKSQQKHENRNNDSPPSTPKEKKTTQTTAKTEERYFDERSDLWSLGVLIYELLTGTSPFRASEPRWVRRQILDLNFDASRIPRVSRSPRRNQNGGPEDEEYDKVRETGEAARDLISKLLKIDANDRLTLEQLPSHPFFDNLDWNLLQPSPSTLQQPQPETQDLPFLPSWANVLYKKDRSLMRWTL